MSFIIVLFLLIGFYFSKKSNNKYLFNFLFGFLLMEFIIRFVPITYNILSINYHDTTFFYIVLLMILGIIISILFNKGQLLAYSSFFNFSGLFSGFSFSLIIYSFIGFIIGLNSLNRKWLIMFILSFLIGFLFNFIGFWMVGYLYGILLGIVGYYLISMMGIVFKCKEKYVCFFLISGMILSYIGGFI